MGSSGINAVHGEVSFGKQFLTSRIMKLILLVLSVIFLQGALGCGWKPIDQWRSFPMPETPEDLDELVRRIDRAIPELGLMEDRQLLPDWIKKGKRAINELGLMEDRQLLPDWIKKGIKKGKRAIPEL